MGHWGFSSKELMQIDVGFQGRLSRVVLVKPHVCKVALAMEDMPAL
jgi:hypothetical protein